MPELTCQELVELVTDFFDDALEPAERARFAAHLSECPGCVAHVAQLRATIELAGATRGLEERPEVSALLQTFREWRRS